MNPTTDHAAKIRLADAEDLAADAHDGQVDPSAPARIADRPATHADCFGGRIELYDVFEHGPTV